MGSALSHLLGYRQKYLEQRQQQLSKPEAAQIALDTGLSMVTVKRLYKRFYQLCRRDSTGCSSSSMAGAEELPSPPQPPPPPPPPPQRLLSRRQMMSDPELSLNPLGARIVCALYPRGSDTMTFAQFCSAIAVFRPARTPAGREAKLQFVYRMLDIEENDFLSLGELCSLLHMLVGNNLPLEQIQSIACRALSEVDQAKDNRISYQEFLAAMEGLDIEEKMAIQF